MSRIAFVQSCWHRDIVDVARAAFAAEMAALGYPAGKIDYFETPGAFEIPLHAKRLAKSGRYDAVVAAGLVVDGGIYRHDFVAGAVINGSVLLGNATNSVDLQGGAMNGRLSLGTGAYGGALRVARFTLTSATPAPLAWAASRHPSFSVGPSPPPAGWRR